MVLQKVYGTIHKTSMLTRFLLGATGSLILIGLIMLFCGSNSICANTGGYKFCKLFVYINSQGLSEIVGIFVTIQGIFTAFVLPKSFDLIQHFATNKIGFSGYISFLDENEIYIYHKKYVFIYFAFACLCLLILQTNIPDDYKLGLFLFISYRTFFNLFLSWKFIDWTQKYTDRTDIVLNDTMNKIKEEITRLQSISTDRINPNVFIYLLSLGFKVVTLYVKEGDIKMLEKFLNDILGICNNLLALQDKDSGKFGAFFLIPDILNKIKEFDTMSSTGGDEQSNKKKKDLELEIALSFTFYSEEQITGRVFFIDKIFELWKIAYQMDKRGQMTKKIGYTLNKILFTLLKDNNSYFELFIEILLGYYSRMLSIILKDTDSDPDFSFFSIAREYYMGLISHYRSEDLGNIGDNYKSKLQRHYMSTLFSIIDHDRFDLFQLIASTRFNGTYGLNINDTSYYDLSDILFAIDYDDSILTELDRGEYLLGNIHTNLQEINEFHNILIQKIIGYIHQSTLSETFKNEYIMQIENFSINMKKYIQNIISYNSVLEILFVLQGYCLFKTQYQEIYQGSVDYIKYIIYLKQYHQPKDSDCRWIGNDVINLPIDTLFKIYQHVRDNHNRRHQDHHGLTPYLDTLYFLHHFNHTFDINLRHYSLNELHRLSGQINGITQIFTNWHQLPISPINIDRIINSSIDKINQQSINFIKQYETLESRIKSAQEERIIQIPISKIRLQQFEEKATSGFEKNRSFKNITSESYNQTYDPIERRGIKELLEKQAFIETDYYQYTGLDEYGKTVAYHENKRIFNYIIEHTTSTLSITTDQIDKINLSQYVIIGSHIGLRKLFKDLIDFTPGWNVKNQNLANITNFYGIYKNINIFTVGGTKLETVVLLHKEDITITEFIPHDSNTENALSVNIFPLNPGDEEYEKIINSKQQRLLDIGDEIKQQEYLQKHVVVGIFIGTKIQGTLSNSYKLIP